MFDLGAKSVFIPYHYSFWRWYHREDEVKAKTKASVLDRE